MRAAALLLLAGCAQIFGLSSPHPAGDAAAGDGAVDTPDGHVDLADAAPGHCITIADCATSVCLPSTVCAADTDVAWLSAAGTLNQACTMAMPCNALTTALATNRPYIRVHGAITQLTSISRDVSIFAEPGGAFSNNNLSINGGNVGLYELELASTCVTANAGTLTAEHIYLHDCTNVGLNANGTLTLDGSTIAKNRSGGVDVGSPAFTITNNVVVANGIGGGGGSMVGGIRIESTTASATSKVDFNTISANNIKTTTGAAGGLYCNITGFTATGNVIAENLVSGGPNGANANTSGACTHASSVIQTNANLGFVNPVTFNFHITASSPLRDAATAAGPATDLDGESRPYGSAYDIGADEYHP
jgi:hypothetical protein